MRSILSAARLNCIVGTAELLVSEVVTNACRHSSVETYVSTERTPDDFRVTVWDHTSGAPKTQTPTDGDERGRGLGIVEAFSDAWGVRNCPHGKAVWFSVAPKGVKD
jgi:anti-sigma regulatory factor (Ser/Thr protein kinase)